jgi:hypothetical protein
LHQIFGFLRGFLDGGPIIYGRLALVNPGHFPMDAAKFTGGDQAATDQISWADGLQAGDVVNQLTLY